MNAVSIVILLLPVLLSLWVCNSVAKKRGLNVQFWNIMALIFGPFAIPFVFFGKPKD